MKIIVTGAAGFIGSTLVDRLIELGHSVLAIDNFSTGKKENLNPKASFLYLNLAACSEHYLSQIIYDFDLIYHLAASPNVELSIQNPVRSNENNLTATLNIFAAAKSAGIKKVVFSSSSAIYGNTDILPTPETVSPNPISPYALQKMMCEEYAKLFCKLYGMTIPCLRYFNVFGHRSPSEGAYVPVIGIWFKQMQERKPLIITGDGLQTRDFVNVDDVVAANLLFLNDELCPSGYTFFNVGFGKNHVLLDVARMCDSNIVHIEPRIETRNTCADITKLNRLGWYPKINLEQWIAENKPRI